jgi:hypothetical protein
MILELIAQLISKKEPSLTEKKRVTMLDNAPLEMEFNINIRAVLIWNWKLVWFNAEPLFSISKSLDDAYSFCPDWCSY